MVENNRIHNSLRNILYGTIKYAVTIIFPFIIRTVLIYKLGAEYAGITSLFSSILQVLSLSELGLSTVVVFALYEPVAKNDNDRICDLLSFFRDVYKKCGVFILCAGLLVCPFIKKLISETNSIEINLYIVFLILLINTSISYLLYGYRGVLFSANQRDDILSKCSILSNLIISVIQFTVLIVWSNYYLYVVCVVIGTIINNLLLNNYAKKMYPEISCTGQIEREEKKKLMKSVGILFGHQLDTVVINSADNIIISTFLGLTTLAIYNNYLYILNAILGVLIMISNAFAGSIGNSIAIETKEKNYISFINFTYFIGMISSLCTILLFVLFQDFMKIWVGNELCLDLGLVFLISLSLYIRQFRRSVITYKIGAGVWEADALKPYVSCITNLILNIILVRIIGLYGVIFSTLACYALIEIPWEIIVFFKEYFYGGIRKYLKTQFIIFIKMIITGTLLYFLAYYISVNNFVEFIIEAMILSALGIIMFFIMSYRDKEFKYIFELLKEICLKYGGGANG